MGDHRLREFLEEVRQAFREDPGLWGDVAQCVLILAVMVAAIYGTVNCCV